MHELLVLVLTDFFGLGRRMNFFGFPVSEDVPPTSLQAKLPSTAQMTTSPLVAATAIGAAAASLSLVRSGAHADLAPSLTFNALGKPFYPVNGYVKPGYERVLEAYRANFEAGDEIGSTLCIYIEGEKVVDLHGGWTDSSRTKPYTPDHQRHIQQRQSDQHFSDPPCDFDGSVSAHGQGRRHLARLRLAPEANKTSGLKTFSHTGVELRGSKKSSTK